ncbi:gliding motility-associated-like protein [Mesonia hippocampi]|uniref:Gliding motility-associated-like protein n=1 Tax=Mesonia hippocampi TaxID=1628250 RepID=A0A840EJC5_9FLAO|nr:T9SS type B sorting domain-containing protein [Mesonia hippocampi]MBB4118258.1 gliding motility-associated-like protein [Mesonia hippocampi]
MKQNFLLIISFIFGVYIHAQNNGQMQTAHWYFGDHAGLDFSSGTPVIDTNGQIATIEGSSSISDEQGNLLFYTDGRRVYDSTHNIMLNGTGLRGDRSSTSSAVILPVPDDCHRYYIFTIDLDASKVPSWRPQRGIEYNIVDMSLNGGLGEVVQKNISLPLNGIIQGYEKLAAISNATKTGYWIVTHFQGDFYAFEVTSTGVSTTPVISPSSIYGGVENIGYLKASPDGTKLAMGMSFSVPSGTDKSLSLYSFNKATGNIHNEQLLYSPNTSQDYKHHFYGIEFSPNSNLLYATVRKLPYDQTVDKICEIWQFNTNSPNINTSKYIFGLENICYGGALQLGLDGKIYINTHTNQANGYYLGRIENPNTAYNTTTGETPIFTPEYLNFGNTSTGVGLPTFLNHYFRIAINVNGLSIQEDQLYCTGELLSFDFCHQGGEIQSVLWEFGDGSTSTEFYPQYAYNTAGVHSITLTLMVDGEEFIRTFDITITGPPEVSNAEQEICLYEGEEHAFNLTESLADINPSNGNHQISFHLTQEEANNNNNPQPTTYTSNQTTTIWVRVEDQQGCFVVRELDLIVYFIPTISIASPINICSGNTATLQAETETTSTVNWYDHENSATPIYTGNPFESPIITQETTYWVEAISPEGCISERAKVTLTIETEEKPYFDIPTIYCINEYAPPLPQKSMNGIAGTWSPSFINTATTGSTTYTFSSLPNACGNSYTSQIEITVEDIKVPEFDIPTLYFFNEEPSELPLISKNGIKGYWEESFNGHIKYYTFYPDESSCAEYFNVQIISYPKFFTPNNDGINDTWSLADIQLKYKELNIKHVSIFDRFGKLLTGFGAYGGWDGTYNGKQMPANDYWFKLEYTLTTPDGDKIEKQLIKNLTLRR